MLTLSSLNIHTSTLASRSTHVAALMHQHLEDVLQNKLKDLQDDKNVIIEL